MLSLNVKTEPCINYRVLILTHLVRFIVSSLALQGMQKYISLRLHAGLLPDGNADTANLVR
jgi:hypothetical protein